MFADGGELAGCDGEPEVGGGVEAESGIGEVDGDVQCAAGEQLVEAGRDAGLGSAGGAGEFGDAVAAVAAEFRQQRGGTGASHRMLLVS